MPVLTQENGLVTVKGLPLRWGVRAYRELKEAQAGAVGEMPEAWKSLSALIDAVIDAPVPIDATDAQIVMLAEQFANECNSFTAFLHDKTQLRQKMAWICDLRGIVAPDHEEDMQVIRRCIDPAFWRRSLRKVHGRAFEHAAIRMGLVSSQQGKYCSDESVKRRIAQNRRNANALESTKMTNTDTGQEFKLSELAAKGTGNKKIRRGELMLRMSGCEQIAIELGHVGIFGTLTTPSKFHAVLERSGKRNPKYNGASPLQAHANLNTVWQRTRAQNGRDNLTPYGFRIAEPHHDGCTHWHMLFFMPAAQVETFRQNLTDYAVEEDRAELGDNVTPRIKFEQIDPAKGTAAGYMMKYVGKNIGENAVKEDIFGNEIITLEMRVDAWAGTWGIRQFQAIGQPPVTTYREFRRVPAEAVEHAPAHVKAAHAACQRVMSAEPNPETGEIELLHAASWAEYIKAQGGMHTGRDCLIAVAAPVVMAEGRYGLIECAKPRGIYCKAAPEIVYKSTRYTWKKSGGAVRFCSPWSSVNNCTQEFAPLWEMEAKQPEAIDDYDQREWFESEEAEQIVLCPHEVQEVLMEAAIASDLIASKTVFTKPLNKKLLEMYGYA